MSARDPSKPAAPVPLPRPLPAPAGERAVGPSDALARYMAELAKYPPISREQEHALALRWREQGDLEAARLLVLANLRLVVKIALEYRRAWSNTLDLIQEGNLGLLQATQRFDPYQGVKLASYAAYWIRAYILKYVLDNVRMVRLGKTRAERKLFFRLNKERRELERRGFEAEPKLLAARLEVSERDVTEMQQRLAEPELSLNAPVRRDEPGAEIGDFVAGAGPSAEQDVADAQMREVFLSRVQEFAKELDERDRTILDQRILAEEPKTLQELGAEFGVSRERVRQLEARLVARIAEYLKQHLVDFDYYVSPRD